ncbi:hypothetical protein GGF32_005028 [Allomyces javanicus]|nr:hypothetical protein GGF32_005028 [Allomyces javanicus]
MLAIVLYALRLPEKRDHHDHAPYPAVQPPLQLQSKSQLESRPEPTPQSCREPHSQSHAHFHPWLQSAPRPQSQPGHARAIDRVPQPQPQSTRPSRVTSSGAQSWPAQPQSEPSPSWDYYVPPKPVPAINTTEKIAFVARLSGGSAHKLVVHPHWTSILHQLFMDTKYLPHEFDLDANRQVVRFCMLRQSGVVHDVMRESGLVMGGVRFDFEPGDPRDAIPPHQHPTRSRDTFVLMNIPRPGFLLPYGFLTVPGAYSERVFRIEDAKTVFATTERLMGELVAMANMAKASVDYRKSSSLRVFHSV